MFLEISKQWLQTKNLSYLLFRVGEICFSFMTLILNSYFVVEFGSLFFCRQCSQILLFSIDHNQNLPWVSIFWNSTELWSSEIINITTLVNFLVWAYNNFLTPLCLEDFYKSSSFFLYRYWKSFLYLLIKEHIQFILRKHPHFIRMLLWATRSTCRMVRMMYCFNEFSKNFVYIWDLNISGHIFELGLMSFL